ncbi:O-antigen ligase-like membrane protein [Saccharothrix saharensis]|uniref:O-antigen ligase-like membrane protein n=1 Tax=Saccharothrix saharensis TaxID=571190 RepID=A0A543J8F6_9PSEU|nr:O-antigen ligase family protein [Saccharothrix saharensis]TQM79101.1 O-antigen ligase-like membrane protein [Saccharothrix saharensis]
MTWLVRALTCTTVFVAPLEGYLLQVHGHLAKVPPALLVATWAVVRVRQRRAPEPHPAHLVLAALAVVLLASWAVHAGGPYATGYALRWLPFLVVAVVLIDVVSREVPVRAVLAASVAGAVVAAVGALLGMVAEGQTRAAGPLEDPNDLAYFLVAALPLLVALRHRALTAVAAVVLAAGAAATFSRGGALALTAAVAWLLARRALPLRALAGGVAALAVLGVAAVLFAGPELDRAVREKTHVAGTNVDTRELRWQAAARMVADHPALGVGPGGFREGYPAASRNAEIDEQSPVAHNMYLEVAAELGVPGFALFVALLALTAVVSERVRRTTPDPMPVLAVQASLIAVVVASTFLSQQYYLPLWSLVAVVAAADLRLRRTSDVACAPRDQ